MPLKVNLGSNQAVDLASASDLVKRLLPGIESVIQFARTDQLDSRISDLPPGFSTLGFSFSKAPSWTIDHTVPLTLTVQPSAGCTLSILRPADVIFQYSAGDDQPVSQKVPPGQWYASITMSCSLAVAGGAQYSAGNLGISGSISASQQFRVVHYHRVQPGVILRDCIAYLFSHFILPFQADSVLSMEDGDCLDFEFEGKLALGFGATYGFSSVMLGGRSGGDVKASFTTPIVKALVTGQPAYQLGAGFQVSYDHEGAFRVIVNRIAGPEFNGANLYLLRQDSSTISAKETFGITVNPTVRFQTDAARLQPEILHLAQKCLPAPAASLADKLIPSAAALAGDINSSVNQLLTKADGRKLALELAQSQTRDDTALFIYKFDFQQQGRQAYGMAMLGDYAGAIALAGTELDPRSFVEQTYRNSAGISLEFFGLLQFHDVTEYIRRAEVTYIGARTFQVRNTEGVKEISGLFHREQEADLYFVAQCRNVAGSVAVSNADVQCQLVFVDRSNTEGIRQTLGMLEALGLNDARTAAGAWNARRTEGALRLTYGGSASLFAGLRVDEYQNGHPAPEPHNYDAANYDAFVTAFRRIVGPCNAASQTFLHSFATYSDWLAFNRGQTDGPGSTKPGDRWSAGNTAAFRWPDGYPPADSALRSLVQAHLFGAQHFMNFCECVKHLAADLSEVETSQQYDNLLTAIRGMIRSEVSSPTYFLKPGLVAMVSLLHGRIEAAGSLPPTGEARDIAITYSIGASGSAGA